MKDFEIKEDIYLILLKYFKGDIIFLDKGILKDLKKSKFKDEEIKEIDKDILRTLEKILKLKKEKPEKYTKTRWIYPEWSEEEKKEKLKEAFPEDYEDEDEDVDEGEDEDVEEAFEEIQSLDSLKKNILPQRKAFIDWINNVFYQKQSDTLNDFNRESNIDEIGIYQYFIRQYS